MWGLEHRDPRAGAGNPFLKHRAGSLLQPRRKDSLAVVASGRGEEERDGTGPEGTRHPREMLAWDLSAMGTLKGSVLTLVSQGTGEKSLPPVADRPEGREAASWRPLQQEGQRGMGGCSAQCCLGSRMAVRRMESSGEQSTRSPWASLLLSLPPPLATAWINLKTSTCEAGLTARQHKCWELSAECLALEKWDLGVTPS